MIWEGLCFHQILLGKVGGCSPGLHSPIYCSPRCPGPHSLYPLWSLLPWAAQPCTLWSLLPWTTRPYPPWFLLPWTTLPCTLWSFQFSAFDSQPCLLGPTISKTTTVALGCVWYCCYQNDIFLQLTSPLSP